MILVHLTISCNESPGTSDNLPQPLIPGLISFSFKNLPRDIKVMPRKWVLVHYLFGLQNYWLKAFSFSMDWSVSGGRCGCPHLLSYELTSFCVWDTFTFIKKVGVDGWTLHVIFFLEWFIAELIFTTLLVPNTLVISMRPKSPNFIAVRITFDSINLNKQCYNTAQQISHSVLPHAALESLVRMGSMELRDERGECLAPRHFRRHCDALSRDGLFRSFELMESNGLLSFLLSLLFCSFHSC